jgi:hypothetical protein
MTGAWVCIGILSAIMVMQFFAIAGLARRVEILLEGFSLLTEWTKGTELKLKAIHEKQERQTSGN